ncbi:glycosyltransferase [Faecalibacterium prausnitzii]|uniref:glycosyltransferase n=1 Tax=Faecalibacterium prausnitzii TaxID=853 RepID=UPI0032B54DED
MSNPILSLCMPTNGVSEWVFPVLDSIYSQGCKNDDFEVVITDNGNNEEFKQYIKAYIQKHQNIQYFETTALPFLNEIESYKRANGILIKFVNHRTKLLPGALKLLIEYARNNACNKPITYFSNGELKLEEKEKNCGTFDEFISSLSYWSSWSTGMTIWKEDFKKLPNDVSGFNELFPHTDVLFSEKNRSSYVINDTIIFDEIPQGKKPKGSYDLFYAFGVEYPSIILELYRNSSITAKTYQKVSRDNLAFVAELYFKYFIKKEYCSYDLSGLGDMYCVFYRKQELMAALLKVVLNKLKNKVR